MKIKQLFQHYWPFIFFLFVGLLVVAINYNGLYGQDAHAYFHFSKHFRNVLWEGIPLNDFFWPVYYPMLGALLTFSESSQAFVLQLISLLSLVCTAYLVRNLLHQRYPTSNEVNSYVFILLCLAPTPLLYGINIMADSMTVFFVVATFYSAYQFDKTKHIHFFVLTASCALIAFLTRYAAAIVVLLPSLWLVYIALKNKKKKPFGYAFLVILLLTIPHMLIKGWNDQSAVSHHWLNSWSFANFFSSTFETIDGLHQFPRPNIAFVLQHAFHPRFLAAGFLILPFIRRVDFKNRFNRLLVSSILFYALFLGGITYQSNRYLMPSFPLIILFLFPAYLRLHNQLTAIFKQAKNLFKLSLIIAQMALFFYFFQPYFKRNQLEHKIVSTLNTRPENIIYSFGMETALENYLIKQEIRSLWEQTYSSFEDGALILFNLSANQKQWAEKTPMINWDHINKQGKVTKVYSWADGWDLYQISIK